MSNYTKNNMLTKAFLFLMVLQLISFTNIYSQITFTPLKDIKTNDSDGVSLYNGAPSLNVTGIVTSTVEPGTGTSGPGTIQDSETGISIYGEFFASKGGVKIGDSVLVLDVKVNPYYGLTELSYNSTSSSVSIISRGHKVTPTVITIPEASQGWNGFEKYESMLVQINNVTFIDTESTFYLNKLSSKQIPYGKYRFVNGSDTLVFYFTSNCPTIVGVPLPKTPVNVVGILSQSCSAAPFNTGYEIIPLDSSAIMNITAVESKVNKDYSYNLYQNYPNPFNPSTTISFSVPFSQKVELIVYDLMGRKVTTLFNSVAHAGITNVNFKADNLASGVYIYTIKTNNGMISKKLVLLK
jgi:hypothetical protein